MKQLENGDWRVDHDHISSWMPKEAWLKQFVGKEGTDWVCILAIYDESDRGKYELLSPLHWIIKDKNAALMFALIWEHK